MTEIEGKKIFVLYPDRFLKEEIFHGDLRNQFEIYFVYDYEKIKPIAERFPGCIICINLVNNDLDWLPGEISGELKTSGENDSPSVIVLYDQKAPDPEYCSRAVIFNDNPDEVKLTLNQAFIEFGGKGRRNFVRYGGRGEKVASIKCFYDGRELTGAVHDISASGLSCSFAENVELPVSNDEIKINIDLSSQTIVLSAVKILERTHGETPIHVFQFAKGMELEKTEELYRFIHTSLDSEMEQLINKL